MSYKAQAIAQELVDELKKRLPTLALVEGFDSNGDPTINIGPGTAGGANVFIRVKGIDWELSKDILGLPSNHYTPHVVQIATEANPAAGAGADVLTRQQLLHVFVATLGKGTRVEWWQSANGTAPTVTTFNTASNLQASVESSLYWTMKASQ